jgi:threonine/homoserine/homoserine lactone efflux protein
MSIETYLLYLGVVAAFFATPPDTSQLLIMSNSLRHGLRRSMATVAGDLSANVVQMTLAAFGLSAILAASAEAFWLIKWAGVAYLLWIGVRLMMARPADAAQRPVQHGRLFRQGFITSSANPYAVIFFAALFPQFIDPMLPVLPQLLVLGVTYLVIDGLILVLWGWLAIRTLGRIKALTNVWLNRVSGALMIGAAVLLGTKDIAQEGAK